MESGKRVKQMRKYEMERISSMKDSLEEKVGVLICDRLIEMEVLYNNNEGNIQEDLEMTLKELLPERKEGKIVIAYLRSSYILNNHEFYIAYYEDEVFVEEEPDHVYFSMYPILKGIDEDLQEIERSLQEKFIRILAWEREEIHRWYMEQIYVRFQNIMKVVVGTMRQESGIEMYYGGYMDEVKIIGNL